VAHGERVSRRLVGGAAVQACFPRFRQRGGWSASVFGRWSNGVGPRVGRWAQGERGTSKIKQNFFFLLPRCMFGGKEERGTVPFKTKPFSPFCFFLIKCMKRRRFGENAPFHLNVAPERANFQISPQSSFVHFNYIPAKFSPRPYSWPRFSLRSLASDLCN